MGQSGCGSIPGTWVQIPTYITSGEGSLWPVVPAWRRNWRIPGEPWSAWTNQRETMFETKTKTWAFVVWIIDSPTWETETGWSLGVYSRPVRAAQWDSVSKQTKTLSISGSMHSAFKHCENQWKPVRMKKLPCENRLAFCDSSVLCLQYCLPMKF